MKRRTTQGLLLCAALLIAAPLVLQSGAKAQNSLSPEHLEKIRQNCVTAQTTMQRVQRSDLATRIQFGRAYDSLMTKLMEPLNTRTVTSRATIAPALAEKTTNLEVSVETFRDHYAEYSNELNRAIDINCAQKPEDFYKSAVRAKELRARLAQDVSTLKMITQSYEKDVRDYAGTLEDGAE